MVISCGGCSQTWYGKAMAHCSTCHETFSCVANFDLHRKVGKCLGPEAIGLVQNFKGTWMKDGEPDVSRLRSLRRQPQGDA